MSDPPRAARGLLYTVGLGSLVAGALLLGSGLGEAQVALQAGAGSAAYARLCAPCHGATGQGTDFGPALADSEMGMEDRVSIITDGSTSMPAFASTLNAQEVEELASYLSTLTGADDGLGRAIYAEQCAVCHGEQGEGGIGPGLVDGEMPLADLIAIIAEGRGAMPGYATRLAPEELEAVAAFSAALQGTTQDTTPPPPDLEPDTPPEEFGPRAYSTHCAACHGPEGAGGLGPNLRTTTLSTDDLRAAVVDGVGSMPGFADSLDAAGVEAVVAHVGSFAAEPVGSQPSLVALGGELFSANCARCHGPDASGAFGPSLKYSTLTDIEMVSVVSNGFGAMPSFAEILTSADVTALVAFVESTREAGADRGGDALTAMAHGRDVFVSSCATCHGFDGTGGVAPSLANTRLTANEVISQVFGIHADRMPAFEGVLDASQVQDVARYVLTIEAEPRSRVPWLVAAALAVVMLAAIGVLWFTGVPDRLARRFR